MSARASGAVLNVLVDLSGWRAHDTACTVNFASGSSGRAWFGAVMGGALHIINVEGGEGVLAGSMAVPMRQRAQLLQALGDGARKAVLPRDVSVQQHVLGRLALVAAVGAPQLLHL